jgi:hypothetical protein
MSQVGADHQLSNETRLSSSATRLVPVLRGSDPAAHMLVNIALAFLSKLEPTTCSI